MPSGIHAFKIRLPLDAFIFFNPTMRASTIHDPIGRTNKHPGLNQLKPGDNIFPVLQFVEASISSHASTAAIFQGR